MKKRTALLASTGISSWGVVPGLPATVSHAPTPPVRGDLVVLDAATLAKLRATCLR